MRRIVAASPEVCSRIAPTPFWSIGSIDATIDRLMTPEPDSLTRTNPRPGDRLAFFGLFVAAVTLVAFRLHGFDLPLETDEANYAYIGARLLEGSRLYVDVWDHQPYGVFVLFAWVIQFFGDAPEVFRWMVVGFSLASLWLIFVILRRAAGSGVAVFGAMLFAIVSADPGTAGEGCNREIYMNTLILVAWYLAICYLGTGRRLALLGAGTSLGVASAIKTVVAVHWLALVVWVVLLSLRPKNTRERLSNVALLAVGPLMLWVGSFVYFAGTGRFEAFVDAVFLFNLGYSGTEYGLLTRFVAFFAPQMRPFIFDSALPFWIVGAMSTLWLFLRACVGIRPRTLSGPSDDPSRSATVSTACANAVSVIVLVVASFVAVSLPGRFWPHYYYLMLPPLVLAIAITVGQVVNLFCRGVEVESHRRRVRALVLAFAAIGGATLWTEYCDYLSQPPLGITFKRYKTRDFLGRAMGRKIKSVTEPGDTIFSYSNDASFYYYSERRCASRYTMITGISEGMAGAERRREILIDELRVSPPRLIVVLFDQQLFPEWKAFLYEFYGEPIGWDFHDISGEPILFVLARKDQPVRPIDWSWDRSMVSQTEAANQP